MRRKGLLLGMVLLLGLTGCVARPVEAPLPTLAPEVQEKEETVGRRQLHDGGDFKERERKS